MSGRAQQHFEEYKEQTKVKHEILGAYLPAFFAILRARHRNLIYIDAFAGRGSYRDPATGEDIDGSPLRSLELITAKDALSQSVSTIFIEKDDANYAALAAAVKRFYSAHGQLREPVVLHGTFAQKVYEIVSGMRRRNQELAPTFLFVDPCGVEGASFGAIKEVMQLRSCEAFVFFNYQGVRRVAGLPDLSPVLVDLYGSEARAKVLVERLRQGRTPFERERAIITTYREALAEDMGVGYTAAFRVESQSARQGSHYLLHATKHPLGFAIMKDVMSRRGRTAEGMPGLELVQASAGPRALLRPQWEGLKRRIVEALAQGPLRAKVFYTEWAQRPDDVFCESAYRKALLELEREERITVLDKKGREPCPIAPKGRRRRGTLAKEYFLRLASD